MGDPLFVSQAKLESWVETGEVTFEDNVLTILAQKQSYDLSPAARILSLLDGEDINGWVGKTMTIEAIEAAGAEHFADSIIAGDTAYQCEEGFMGQQQGGTAVAPRPSGAPLPPPPKVVPKPAAPPAAAPAPTESKTGPDEDVDLLRDFLLENLD